MSERTDACVKNKVISKAPVEIMKSVERASGNGALWRRSAALHVSQSRSPSPRGFCVYTSVVKTLFHNNCICSLYFWKLKANSE